MASIVPRYVGTPDIHDGFVRKVRQEGNEFFVTIQGDSGKYYLVRFHNVQVIESETPEGMELYGLVEYDVEDPRLRRFELVNWHCDEPDTEEFKSKLVIIAAGFELKVLVDQVPSNP